MTRIYALLALLAAVVIFPLGESPDAFARGPATERSGRLEVLVLEDFERGTSETQVFLREDSGRRTRLKLSKPNGEIRHGVRVRVRGAKRGDAIEVVEVLAAGGGAAGTASAQSSGSGSVADEERKAVVLMVDLLDASASSRWTLEQISDRMYGSERNVADLYTVSSDGGLSFDDDVDGDGGTDVFGPFQINYSAASCDYTLWGIAADAAATAAGIDLSLYEHRVYVLPKKTDTACTWSGLAFLGCYDFCKAWIGRADLPLVFAHELGHNLGMHHASTDLDNDGNVDKEYGDKSGVMGGLSGWHLFNAPHADQLGWIDFTDVLPITFGLEYTIYSMSLDPATVPFPRVATIEKPDTNELYYLSYRQPLGYDDSLAPAYTDGVSVHRYAGSGPTRTFFIGSLVDGGVFEDAANGIRVTQIASAADGSWVRVGVDLGCVEREPFVGVQPASQTVPPGGISYFSVVLLNLDDYGCEPRVFSLEAYLPGGLPGFLEDSWITLPPLHHEYTGVWTLGLSPGTYDWGLRVDGFEGASATVVVTP